MSYPIHLELRRQEEKKKKKGVVQSLIHSFLNSVSETVSLLNSLSYHMAHMMNPGPLHVRNHSTQYP